MLNDHDPHHDHDYRNWAEKAKANGSEEAGALVEEGATLRCYWRLTKGIKKPWGQLEMNRNPVCRRANSGGSFVDKDKGGV